jgi:cell division protein FtsQ
LGGGVERRVARGNRRRVDRDEPPGGGGALGRALLRGLGLLAVTAAVAGLVALGARELARGRLLRIREIRYVGLARATGEELSALSPVRPGDHLVSADVDALARALRRHPWVKAVEVHRRLPPALEARVTERQAVALVDLGGLYLVDADAEPFKRAAPGDGLDLPLVTGFSREDWVKRRAEVEPMLRGALALHASWREAGLERVAALSEIHVEADGITVYAGEEGTQVRLGSGDLPQKLARLRSVLSTLRAEGRKAEVLHLDNRIHPSWVTVRVAGLAPGGSGR